MSTNPLLAFRVCVLLLLLVGIWTTAAAQETSPAEAGFPTFAGLPPAGTLLEPITVVGPDDESLREISYVGQPTVLFLWAPNCFGGERLLGALDELQPQLEERGVMSVFISIDPSSERVQQALGEFRPPMGVTLLASGSESLSHPALRARREAGEKIRVGVLLPSFILLDSDGLVKASGPWRGTEHLLGELKQLARP